MYLTFALLSACFLPSTADSSKLNNRGNARCLHPFADDEEQVKAAESEGATAAGARMPPYDIPDMDPEDAVVAHSLFDPHLEPQDADGELEDPSMLPSSGVGYEIEKHDQLIEDEVATGAAQHRRKGQNGGGTRLNTGNKSIQSTRMQQPQKQQQQRLEEPRLAQQDEEEFTAEEDEAQVEADTEAGEEEEVQREEQIDEKEEAQHNLEQAIQEAAGKSRPPPPKLPPDEARKLLLSYGAGLEDIINQIISAHAGVPDLLGTKARKDQAEGKSPMRPPPFSRPRSINQQTPAGTAAAAQAMLPPAVGIPMPVAGVPAGVETPSFL